MVGNNRADHQFGGASNTIGFGQKFVESEQFKSLFQEGMTLVEETAAYLDGTGREEAKKLSGPLSLVYATESMRLTTRLMQLASWLLVRRAVNEGEMTPDEAFREKNRIKLRAIGRASHTKNFDCLPDRLKDLVQASFRLYDRILLLDKLIQSEREQSIAVAHGQSINPNPHLEHLRNSFEFNHSASKD